MIFLLGFVVVWVSSHFIHVKKKKKGRSKYIDRPATGHVTPNMGCHVSHFQLLDYSHPQQNPTPTLYMAILHCTSLPFLSLRTTISSSKSTLTSTRIPLFLAMNSFAKSEPVSSSASSSSSTYQQVPEQDANNDLDRVADNTFRRYTSNVTKGSGKGTAIVWFRNDLRVLDNEALYKAWLSSETVLPVYCVDPRLFATTYHFGFPKTGGTVI